jgi:hypothetical protein
VLETAAAAAAAATVKWAVNVQAVALAWRLPEHEWWVEHSGSSSSGQEGSAAEAGSFSEAARGGCSLAAAWLEIVA